MRVCVTGTTMSTTTPVLTYVVEVELFPFSVTLLHLLVQFLFVAVPADPVPVISNIVTHRTMAFCA
jgi:hypothetical protein